MRVLAYIVLAMILYDWSVHLIFLFGKEDFFITKRLNYWPEWNNPDKKKRQVRYQQFWSVFWGTAFVLLLIFLVKS